MTGRQFYDRQTAGGANDVMKSVAVLEQSEVPWCAIGGVAMNHWAAEPMVTRDVVFAVACLEDALAGKIQAWRDPAHRQSKRLKDLGDMARLVEAHPALRSRLPDDVTSRLD